ncbi:apical junction molecule-like [Ostrinia furnacalis]|uniref:apical junction molecule-like n=1 Tax=Ostrinia furnacalis TaxID=93504 RepID=UPI00103DAB9D|nr:apical junction molecule-like [Ostrinia furnacalis]
MGAARRKKRRQKLTREEKLEKKRIAERLRTERIRADPVLMALYKEKNKEKYIRKKERGRKKRRRKLTREEKLEKKRIAERLRKERIRSDPVLMALYKEKNKKCILEKKNKAKSSLLIFCPRRNRHYAGKKTANPPGCRKRRKRKLTREETLEKKRIAERLRKERIRSDPVLMALYKEKNKEMYIRKKERGEVIPMNLLPKKEQALRRKRNRENFRHLRINA